MALFGLTPSPKAAPASASAPDASDNAAIFDVSAAEFQDRVLQASMERPVLVDFWAPWCGPCKQLMPVLEGEVAQANGEILLAKINIDENPELAQALQIQSVPTVMAFFQGQPVTGFTGARPQSEIRSLIAQLVKLSKSARPDALDIPATMKEAAALIAAQDFSGAQDLYFQVLQQDETNAEAFVGLVRTMIGVDALDEAQAMIEGASDEIRKNPAFAAAQTALDLARGAASARAGLAPLQTASEAEPGNHQARFDLAQAQFAAGQRGEAVDNLLSIIAADRGWNDESARKELLRFFEALGFSDPLSIEGRKKLSRILFS